MDTEREILITILKMTREGPVKIIEVYDEARIPSEILYNLLNKSMNQGIVQLKDGLITQSQEQRLRAAIRVVKLGADIETVCKFLTWGEFEDIAMFAFEANDFTTMKHFRFSWFGKRREIDMLALRKPIIASVDCKHWHRGWKGSASIKAVEQQIKRTEAMAKASKYMVEKLGLKGWNRAQFIPIILSLMPSTTKFIKNVPVVPVLQLRDFLQGMPAFINNFIRFRMDFSL